MTSKTIGIIGAGQMGCGIAQISAQKGYKVILQDISEKSLEKANHTILKNLDKYVSKGKITEDNKNKTLQNLSFHNTLQPLEQCDFLIEAATENQEIKKTIFESLRTIISKDCLVATNTSSLSITELSRSVPYSENFMGVHFMNPVPIMKLVELIKGLGTSDQTYQAFYDFILSLDKEIAVSADYPAFIVNRLLIPMINEAIFLLYETIADKDSIDKSMQYGAGFPMGPLALADLIGLDTCLAIMNRLYDGFKDPKYRPCPLLVQYVEAGWLGKKTQKGFYTY